MVREGFRAMRALVVSMLASTLLACVPAVALAEGGAASFGNVAVASERFGIGGAGALSDPAASPSDADETAVGTDMGGSYVSDPDPDPAQVAAVKAAAVAAIAYADEQGFAFPAIKDAFEARLSGALCYSVGEGGYHVLYGGGYYAFTVGADKAVTADAAARSDRLPVFDTPADARADLSAVSSGFLTRGLAAAGDKGHGYYAQVNALATGDQGFTEGTRSFALASAEGAVNPYQLGYADKPDDATNSVDDAIAAFHASAFHTLVFPAGEYRLARKVWSNVDDRSYYGLGATLYTDGAVTQTRNPGHNSLWTIRGDFAYGRGTETYVNDQGNTVRNLYESYGTDAEMDIDIHDERATIGEITSRYLFMFNGTPSYNGHSITLTDCVYDIATNDAGSPRVAYSAADIVDGLSLNLVGCDISGVDGPQNYTIAQGADKVDIKVSDDRKSRDSVAAMVADVELAAGDVVATKAYYAGGDAAGAGTYDVKAAGDVRFANAFGACDGGRYIMLKNGLVAVLRTPADAVDLYQYGARGDGATDDSVCVRAAFVSGLATVRVSAGTYVCVGAVIPSGTSVVGAGRDTCAFVSPLGEGGYGTAGPLGVASGAHDVALRGVTVDGRRDVYERTHVPKDAGAPELSGDAAHFVYDAGGAGNYTLFGWLGGAENVLVEGCRFKSNNSEAVKFVGGKGISFADCEFLDVDCGIITQGGGEEGNVTCLTVDGCTFDGHWFSEPISMFAEGSRYEKLVFTNNVFKNKPAGSAILLYSDDDERKNTFRDVTISGNSVRRCSGGLSLYKVDGATITDNDLGGSTARLFGCSNMTLEGLAFESCLQSALVLRDCTNVKVTGLTVDGFGVDSPIFPAISVGDATGGQNAGCSISGTVRGAARPDGQWRSAVIASAGGVDLSGVTFDVEAKVHALFVGAGVSGLVYHTTQDVSVYDGSETLQNDIVVKHGATLFGGAGLDNWNRTHNTDYTLNWTTSASESLTYMQACQDGFVRTLAVNAVGSDAVLADGDGSQGSIAWLGGGHTVAKGASATYKLVCQGGVWHELGADTPDAPAHSHTLRAVKAVGATCTEAGNVAYWVCDGCGKLFGDEAGEHEITAGDTTVPALGHRRVRASTIRPATCLGTGVASYVCAHDPSHMKTSTVSALGHAWDGGVVTVAATCTETGTRTYTCRRDRTHAYTETIPALGHRWDDGVVTKVPSCEEPGRLTRVCLNDVAHTTSEELPSLGHDWGAWEEVASASCASQGSERRVCLRDGSHVEERALPATAHVLVRVPEVPATCEGAGVASHWTCSSCDRPFLDEAATIGADAGSLALPALGHDWGEGVVTVPATYGEPGATVYTCRHDASHTKTEPIPRLDPSVDMPILHVRAHVQGVGWLDQVDGGEVAGTTGASRRLEAFSLDLSGVPVAGGVEYRAAVQGVGWQAWATEGQTAGTVGHARSVEAVEMRLTGELAEAYDLWYRVHAQGVGWMGWACGDMPAGVVGRGLRVEALQATLVPRGADVPRDPSVSDAAPAYMGSLVTCAAHAQSLGWLPAVFDGAVAGSTGQSRRLESFELALVDQPFSGSVAYRAHVQGIGWLDWQSAGDVAGTVGRGLRLEAFEMRLTGEMAERYDLWYRAHVQGIGWQGWVRNGATAGTTGRALRVEALQAMLLPKGTTPATALWR